MHLTRKQAEFIIERAVYSPVFLCVTELLLPCGEKVIRIDAIFALN